MILENYKLIDFLQLEKETVEQYLIALRYLKPRETKRKVFDMKLKHVEMIKQNINSGEDIDLYKIVSKVEKITVEAVLDLPIIEFFGIMASIREQIEQITSAEENGLKPTRVNVKWELVQGSERKARFGIYNTLEELSGGDALQYKKYMKMNYSEIFTILLMRKTDSDLQHEMNLIKTK